LWCSFLLPLPLPVLVGISHLFLPCVPFALPSSLAMPVLVIMGVSGMPPPDLTLCPVRLNS
jgi:hypothetical protein